MLLALIAALLIGSPVEKPVSIRSGETVTIEFEGSNAKVVERSSAAPMGEFEQALLSRLQLQSSQLPAGSGVVPPEAIHRGQIDAAPPVAPPGKVQITFRNVASLDPSKPGDSVLTIENSTGQKFHYRAIMHGNGRSAPTDVCEVPSGKPGMEHWPYVIEYFELWDLSLLTADPLTIRCQ